MMRTLTIAALAATLALTGCSTMPIYEAKPADVRIQLLGMGKPGMCVGGTHYQLPVTEEKGIRTVRVPTGNRVMLWSTMVFQGYNVMSSCQPLLAFVPAAGHSYVSNAGLTDGKCFIELVREDSLRATGVAPEPTLQRPKC
ncbi:MAG: hypothetical protein V4633_12670 [Pseudomonadota bacterium]